MQTIEIKRIVESLVRQYGAECARSHIAAGGYPLELRVLALGLVASYETSIINAAAPGDDSHNLPDSIAS